MNRIMRNSGAALAAIFIAGSLTACGPGSASSSRSDTNPTEVSTDLGNKKYELTLWDGAGLKAVDEALIAGFEAKYPNITITGQYDPDNVSGQNGPRVISAKDAPDIAPRHRHEFSGSWQPFGVFRGICGCVRLGCSRFAD